MSHDHDTDWKVSAKGNLWRLKNLQVLVVGTTQDDRVWARIDEKFINGQFETIDDAKLMCEWEAR
jgi:hypothetical protein